MSKYGSKKVLINGITFDSKKEAKRYYELKLLERAGEITELETQYKFLLQPAFKKNGKTIRAMYYIADFVYKDTRSGKTIVEDTKGFRTEAYNIKKKLFEYAYPTLTIKEV